MVVTLFFFFIVALAGRERLVWGGRCSSLVEGYRRFLVVEHVELLNSCLAVATL